MLIIIMLEQAVYQRMALTDKVGIKERPTDDLNLTSHVIIILLL